MHLLAITINALLWISYYTLPQKYVIISPDPPHNLIRLLENQQMGKITFKGFIIEMSISQFTVNVSVCVFLSISTHAHTKLKNCNKKIQQNWSK